VALRQPPSREAELDGLTEVLADAVGRIRAWGEGHDWRGYDPYDALNSPAAPILTLGTPLGRRVLMQAVKLSPLNLRPALRIAPAYNAKAIGLVASGYSRLHAATGEASAREHASRWLSWLCDHHSGGGDGLAWGYPFDVQTRFFGYRRGTPNSIATSFVAHAFLDGRELLGEERWAQPAREAARFLITRMRAGDHFRYVREEDELVHNANALASAVLVRTARATGDDSLLLPASAALAATLRAQRDDGSWAYSEGPRGNWVDNFHTAYVLESLAHCADLLPEVPDRLDRAVDYWVRSLFLEDGTPKYEPERVHPVDSHCYASAIDAWIAVGDTRADAHERAERLARLLIERMLDPAGFVHFQQHRFWTSRVPFVRWTTAPSFRALAGLMLTESRDESAHAHLD
jgi:hypothetical protein